ncbi:MAG: hypothetical protein ACI9FR_001926 [Cryomorphaceae bacterium]|jgi:hypothetical protein
MLRDMLFNAALVIMASSAQASTNAGAITEPVKVDAFNYVRAKTAIQFDKYLANARL